MNFCCNQVTDNVGVDAGQVTSWPARDNEFSVGITTPVTYTATDRAGHRSSCTFNVEVQARPQGQHKNNSYHHCSEYLTCFLYLWFFSFDFEHSVTSMIHISISVHSVYFHTRHSTGNGVLHPWRIYHIN